MNTALIEDIKYSKMVLLENYHYYCEWQQDIVDKHALLKNISKRPNAVMKISSIEHVPLLLRQVQIGTMHSAQRELLIEELSLRGLIVNLKELITHLKKMLIEVEHLGETDPNKKKYFYPYFLTATD